MPQIKAQLNYLRISPRKVRAVAGLLKGLDVDEAIAQLSYLTRRPTKPILKLLNSAVSNARHLGLDKNYLYIKEIMVNEGMKLKRYKPKGFSLVMPIQKKTSHIKIVLDELSEEKKKKKEKLIAKMPKVEEKKPSFAKDTEGEKEVKIKKPKFGKEMERVSKKGGFGGIKTLGRKLFRRKVV
ncbi:MAG: 50S ribosomal protein L22 [Patescibacteria group bacterium]